MPKYQVTHKGTGQSFIFEGDSIYPPTEDDINQYVQSGMDGSVQQTGAMPIEPRIKAQMQQEATKRGAKPLTLEDAVVAENVITGEKKYDQNILAQIEAQQEVKSPLKQWERASSLRKEFSSLPEVKEYIEVSTRAKELDGLMKKAKNSPSKQNYNALDQGLITIFNKVTDPTSVVRESEYARVGENLPMVNRMQVALGKWQNGQQLTNADREAIVEAAKIITDEIGKTYNEAYKSYGTLAEEQALVKKESVLGRYKEHKPLVSYKTESKATKRTIKLPSGKSIEIGG